MANSYLERDQFKSVMTDALGTHAYALILSECLPNILKESAEFELWDYFVADFSFELNEFGVYSQFEVTYDLCDSQLRLSLHLKG